MKIEIKKVVSFQDLDELVVKTYGRPYNFQQQDYCRYRGTVEITIPDRANDYKNESVPEVVNGEKMGVSFSAWLKRDPKAPLTSEESRVRSEPWAIEMWWHRNFYPDIQTVANDLHAKGLIPAGEYLIEIDW